MTEPSLFTLAGAHDEIDRLRAALQDVADYAAQEKRDTQLVIDRSSSETVGFYLKGQMDAYDDVLAFLDAHHEVTPALTRETT